MNGTIGQRQGVRDLVTGGGAGGRERHREGEKLPQQFGLESRIQVDGGPGQRVGELVKFGGRERRAARSVANLGN